MLSVAQGYISSAQQRSLTYVHHSSYIMLIFTWLKLSFHDQNIRKHNTDGEGCIPVFYRLCKNI